MVFLVPWHNSGLFTINDAIYRLLRNGHGRSHKSRKWMEAVLHSVYPK